MRRIYTGVDIGSNTIKTVVFELCKNKLNLLATSSVKSKGIKKGLITDFNEASLSMKQGFDKIEKMIGVKIKKAVATVPSYFSDYLKVEGSVNIQNGTVSGKDVSNVCEMAVKSKLAPNREMVTVIPIDFRVDGGNPVKDPKGLNGENLSVRAILVTTPTKNIYSVVNLIEHVGVEVVDILTGGVGDIYTFRNDIIDKQVGAIINIGSEITNITLYNKGIAVKNAIVQRGGKNIDNDISYMYKIDVNVANELKEKFVFGHKKYASQNEFKEVVDINGNKVKINQFELSEIVMSRVEEIFSLAKEQINVLTNKEIQYIILTGGSSNLPQIKMVASEILGDVTLGSIKLIGVRDNKYSSVIGSIIYFINRLKLRGNNYSMMTKEDEDEISSIKKGRNNSNEMLGEVFEYFLGE